MRAVKYFRVFRVRELAGRSGSASETPPLNPPRRSKEVGVAHRHNSRQQGKRYRPATNEGTGNAAGGKADPTSTTSLPAPPLAKNADVKQTVKGGVLRTRSSARLCTTTPQTASACWPAGAASGRWAWRGRGARRGSRRVRVVCRAERRRDKFKRQRRSGVMVCVSVFVTHQEARGRF